MEDSTGSKFGNETIGIAIVILALIAIIFMRAGEIKKENITPRDGTTVTAK